MMFKRSVTKKRLESLERIVSKRYNLSLSDDLSSHRITVTHEQVKALRRGERVVLESGSFNESFTANDFVALTEKEIMCEACYKHNKNRFMPADCIRNISDLIIAASSNKLYEWIGEGGRVGLGKKHACFKS